MSITPGFLDELRHRLVLSDLVGRKVQFDKRKSNPRKRDYWACCPFHHEKSPSFHVEDDKGRYYCFGCGAKGDAVTFVMETENLTFPEAVESLAGLVGMSVPKPTPQARAQEKARAERVDLMSAAVDFYSARLSGAGGEGARAYLDRRGLSPDVCEQFALGYAPGTGRALLEHLQGLGAKPADLIASGLAGQRDPDRPPYDYFRDRLMFPIRDRQGRPIGFGARTLQAGVEPKYLNSPETDLFKKGRVLYNLDQARRASRDMGTVILAEGYMDVIAFHRAGLGAAVAPLGTALTEEQLTEAWRLTPEPVLCFDGDAAGLKAAYRALDLALGLVTPERTLRFALLEGGQDPDDVLRESGPEGLKQAIAKAVGAADLLWRRELEAAPLDTPERRAGLEARLEAAAEQIADQNLRYHFRQDLRSRAKSFFRQQREVAFARERQQGGRRGGTFSSGRGAPRSGASPELRASALARAARPRAQAQPSLDQILSMVGDVRRHILFSERAILAMVLDHPELVERDPEGFAGLIFEDADLSRLARVLLGVFEEQEGLDTSGLKGQLQHMGIGDIVASVLECSFVHASRSPSGALQSEQLDAQWHSMIARHHIVSAKSTELRHALNELRKAFTEDNHNRLMDLCRQIAVVSDPHERTAHEGGG